MIDRYSHDVSTGTAHVRGVTASESSQAQALKSHYEKLAEIGGITKDQAAVLTGQARVGGGWDFIVKVGADGSVMWRGQTIESETWNRIKEYDRQHGFTETWSQVADASKRYYSTQTGDSEMASLDESLSANLSCTPPLMRRPVQMMISVRAGRSFLIAFRDAIVRFVLGRAFADVASPGQRRMSPSAMAWNLSTT